MKIYYKNKGNLIKRKNVIANNNFAIQKYYL